MKIIEGFENAKALFTRQGGPGAKVDEEREKIVRQIIERVRREGDKALFDYSEKLDGIKLNALEVKKEAIERAYRETDKELLSAMELSAERIKVYHLMQRKKLVKDSTSGRLGWVMRPPKQNRDLYTWFRNTAPVIAPRDGRSRTRGQR